MMYLIYIVVLSNFSYHFVDKIFMNKTTKAQ